jgi:hypothetical protein
LVVGLASFQRAVAILTVDYFDLVVHLLLREWPGAVKTVVSDENYSIDQLETFAPSFILCAGGRIGLRLLGWRWTIFAGGRVAEILHAKFLGMFDPFSTWCIGV